jgi:hypothetical protein
MLSVGELPSVLRVMKDWRKINYKNDPITEQLYRDEFTKNKSDLIHPILFDFLRDEEAWTRDVTEHQRLVDLMTPDTLGWAGDRSIFKRDTSLGHVASEDTIAESPEIVDRDGDLNKPKRLQSKPRDIRGEGRGLQQSREKGIRFVREEVPPLKAPPAVIEVESRKRAASSLSLVLAERMQKEHALELQIFVCCSTATSGPSKRPPLRIRVPEGEKYPMSVAC